MAHYLLTGSSQPLRLHIEERTDTLDERLRAGWENRELVEVQATFSARIEPDWVVVNPSVLPWWSITWLADGDESLGE